MKNKTFTKILIVIIAGICVLGILSFIFPASLKSRGVSSIPHQNPVDKKISQYSDTHITNNAKATSPEFKNLAFEPVPASPLFSNELAAVVRAVKSLTLSTKEENKEYGSWVWTPVMEMAPAYIESILSDAKVNGVNTIYVSIDSYLDIFVMPKGQARENTKKTFSDKLEYFITEANKKGIVVDAEAGWRNWAEGDNIYKAFAVVSFVKNFNSTNQNQFRGFQYDVEPYLLDNYTKNETSILKNFISLVDQTEYFMGTSTLRFSVAVPDFYDQKDGFTPLISYNGSKNYTFRHLLNILDKRPDSSIIIMSYRNFADSVDGTIGISKNEMLTAKDGHYTTKIIIAQETGDVPPPYITFHNTSKSYLLEQITKIKTAFSPYSNFGGIAIHYANAFLALK